MDKDTRVNMNCGPSSGTPEASAVDDDQGVIVAGAAARAAAQPVESGAGTACAAGVGGAADSAADSAAEKVIDPIREDAYWRDNFAGRTYVEQGASFGDYGPAYGFGVISYGRYPGRSFEDVESEMSGSWSASRGGSSLSGERAKQAVRDAWNRINGSA